MKRILTVLLLLIIKLSFSQNYADSLNGFYKRIIQEKQDSTTEKYSQKIVNLTEQLVEQNLVNQNLIDSLNGISLLISDNKNVIVLTYDLVNKNNRLLYKGVVFNKVNKTWYKNILQDIGSKEIKLENYIGKPEAWLGCRYYKIITIKEKGRQNYALLASNLSNKTISRKWIDVLVIDEKYDIYFGDNIFEGLPIKRFVLQYNSKIVTSLKYNKKKR